ncbi:DNA ligase [Bienertia sinuspersici]
MYTIEVSELSCCFLQLRTHKPTMSFSKLGKSLPFSGVLRKLEQDVETVIRVLQPGPVGIVEHKFTNEEIHKASATVRSAVQNWQTRAKLEKSGILKDFIEL